MPCHASTISAVASDSIAIRIDPEVAAIVRPGTLVLDPVVVREGDAQLDGPLAAAEAAARSQAERTAVTQAVRAMYRRFGVDPTRTRPSSEALLRRVRKGDRLPRINSLVDVVNWCSLESQLPFGLYDLAHVRGGVTIRLGRPGESYAGIRKDEVHLDGRLVVADDVGPFGNPTSDSARTMVTPATTRALVVIFAPAEVPAADVASAVETTRRRAGAWARGAVQRPASTGC